MTISHIIILLTTGVFAGFGSGLLGVGGGFITTPVQYMVFTNMGVPPDVAVKLAFGTTLLVILPTAISGAWRHHKQGAVWWRAAIIMGSFGSIAAFGGAALAAILPGETLKIAFGALALATGIRMCFSGKPLVEKQPKDKWWLWIAAAIPIGMVTGILGIGGGILMIPVMRMFLGVKMHNAVAISLATMMFTSLGGVAGYIMNGLSVPNLPLYSIGYVNLLSWFLLTVTSIGMAQVGAVASQHLRGRYLRYIFCAIMGYMGLRMVGVFDWLGWPI